MHKGSLYRRLIDPIHSTRRKTIFAYEIRSVVVKDHKTMPHPLHSAFKSQVTFRRS